MKLINKRRWRIIKTYIIGWTVAFILLCIIRGIGTIEIGLQQQYDFLTSVMASLILGPTFGCVSGYVQILTEERVYKRMSIRTLLLLKFIYTLVFMFALIAAGYVISNLFLGIKKDFASFVFDAGSLAIYFYVVIVELFMTILSQVNLMFGDNKLGQLLTGKFYWPREEERVFMFLDLHSSTQLAERLGHIKYSRLIQDCFNDLGVVAENEAEIYQYVGDEVILTWELKDGLRDQNCLNAYFNFRRQLMKKQRSYIEKYDCVPFFKAGVHAGIVTVTEVGKYKKEIAYHGDTINTAARIQGKCNEFNQEILISESLRKRLGKGRFQFDELGSVALRGKEKEVIVYAAFERSHDSKQKINLLR